MLTYTEQVHALFGTAMAAMGAVAWWSERREQSPARLVWPALAFLIGLLLFIPVDVGTGAYDRIGVWNTVISVVPDSAGYWVQRWVRPLVHLHVIQHKLTGVLAMILGLVELGRGSGRLRDPRWQWVLPGALIGMALALGLHGGNAMHLPSHVEQLHHRVLGVGLGIGGVVLVLAQRGYLKAPAWRSLWCIMVLATGLDLAFFYRLARHP
jgi:hypothetical protein